MEVVPFHIIEDEEYNEEYNFMFTSDTKKSNKLEDCYHTKIIVDGLNDNLLIKKDCECKGFLYKHDCKHCKMAIDIIKKFVGIRENE